MSIASRARQRGKGLWRREPLRLFCQVFARQPGRRFRMRGSDYLWNESGTLRKIRVASLVDPKTRVLAWDKPKHLDRNYEPKPVAWALTDKDGTEFVTQDHRHVEAIQECESSGWTAVIRFIRSGGRQHIMEVKTA